jgi:hypothetical protein
MEAAALVVSLVSLGIAGLTAYVSHFQRARLSISYGSYVKVYYTSNGSLSFYIPIVAINRGVRLGTVSSISISYRDVDRPSLEFIFPWRGFSEFDPDSGSWRFRDIASPVAVAGGSSIAKYVWFSWPDEIDEKPAIGPGLHRIDLTANLAGRSPTIRSSLSFKMTDVDAQTLSKARADRNSTTVEIGVIGHVPEYQIVDSGE